MTAGAGADAPRSPMPATPPGVRQASAQALGSGQTQVRHSERALDLKAPLSAPPHVEGKLPSSSELTRDALRHAGGDSSIPYGCSAATL